MSTINYIYAEHCQPSALLFVLGTAFRSRVPELSTCYSEELNFL